MSKQSHYIGWELPEDIKLKTGDSVEGYATLANDSEDITSPFFPTRQEALDWLKAEVTLMNGNAILNLRFSDHDEGKSHWFSGRAALVAKSVMMESSEDAGVSKIMVKASRTAFYREQVRVQKEREVYRANQALMLARKKKLKSRIIRGAALIGMMALGTGLVYALPF